jgi:putative protease
MMSPKDLCTLDFLDQVIDTGVKVLKIEGRGRAPEYVAKVIKTYREAIDAHTHGTFDKERVAQWMGALEKVYNRGFWSGYYLGQKLGEWSEVNGSKATQKKVYVGKGVHFFPKANIGEFKIEAYDLKLGDTILIQGPTTGAQELELSEMLVNDQAQETATKGDSITVPLSFRIRPSDKLYKVVKTEYATA